MLYNFTLKPIMNHKLKNLFITLLACLTITATTNAELKQYSFGVFPYLPAEKLEQIWSPVALYMEQQLDVDIIFRTRASFNTFENEIQSETFDIAFIQPFVYARIASKHNYIPLTRNSSFTDKENRGMLKAIFVTLKENKLLKIADLRGKTIATPPASSAVSILARDYLLKQGLRAGIDYQIATYSNHNSCMRQLIINNPIACVTSYPPFIRFNRMSNNRLAVMASTNEIPSSLIVVHKRVPEKDMKIIKNIFLNLQDNDLSRIFLERSSMASFVPAQDKDYDVVRNILKRINNR